VAECRSIVKSDPSLRRPSSSITEKFSAIGPRQKKLRAVGDLPPSLHGQGRARRSRRKTVYVLHGGTTVRE
jgi:hypothetical protein